MSVDVKFWNGLFAEINPDAITNWPCPKCGQRSVSLERKALAFRENKRQFKTKDFQKEDFEKNSLLGFFIVLASTVEHMQYVQSQFAGFLKCNNCSESIVFSGRAEVPKEDKSKTLYLTTKLYPEYFSPALHFIRLDNKYPVNIRESFIRSFGLVFNDPASAANSIRNGVELMLDALLVARKNENGARLNLYKRIEKLGESRGDYAEMLHGLRLLGNEGSHSDKITRSDLLSAYRVVDFILEEEFIRAVERANTLKLSRNMVERYSPKTLE